MVSTCFRISKHRRHVSVDDEFKRPNSDQVLGSYKNLHPMVITDYSCPSWGVDFYSDQVLGSYKNLHPRMDNCNL